MLVKCLWSYQRTGKIFHAYLKVLEWWLAGIICEEQALLSYLEEGQSRNKLIDLLYRWRDLRKTKHAYFQVETANSNYEEIWIKSTKYRVLEVTSQFSSWLAAKEVQKDTMLCL